MPNPKLETYKNKATGTVYDYTDAAAQAALAGILDGTDIDSFEDVETALATKVDKVTGKGLSTNDYDDTEKAKVAGAVQWADAEKSVKKNLWNTDITNGTANVGMAVTHNSDKSIKLNGTTTAGFNFPNTENSVSKIFNLEAGKSYIFSTQTTNPNVIKQVYVKDTSSSGWRQIAEDTSNPKMTFTMPDTFYDYWVRLRIESGRQVNETFYPMIYEATILDDTYAPYIPDNTELFPRSEQAVLGAKNLLDIIATSSGNFTVNSDKTITANGTFNERTVFYLRTKQTNFVLNKGTYTVSITDIASVIKCVVDAYNGDTWVKNLATTTTKADFSVDYNGYDRIVVYLLIDTADIPATINNVKLSPMIRLATDPDDTYAPYAMTNRELTDKATVKTIAHATAITEGDLSVTFTEYITGNVEQIVGVISSSVDKDITSQSGISIGTALAHKPLSSAEVIGSIDSSLSASDRRPICSIRISNTGRISVDGQMSANRSYTFTITYIFGS